MPVPLINDFFYTFFNKPSFKHIAKDYEDVFSYLQKEWNFTLNDKSLNLEEVLTVLEFKTQNFNGEEKICLQKIKSRIEEIIFLLLSSYEFTSYHYNALEVLRFTKLFLSEKNSDILTFNYDNIIEKAIEINSGHSIGRISKEEKEMIKKEIKLYFENTGNYKPNEKLLSKFRYDWMRILSYPFEFDFLTCEFIEFPEQFIKGDGFYKINKLYNKKRLLKLHGSISWFKFLYNKLPFYNQLEKYKVSKDSTLFSTFNNFFIETDTSFRSVKKKEDYFDFWRWKVQPMIIVPVMFKKYNRFPFNLLWNTAKYLVQEANEIVIIGYSFSDTDIYSRILLRENIKSNAKITIVDKDFSLENKFYDLVKNKLKIQMFKNLGEYLDYKKIEREKIHLLINEENSQIWNYTIGLEKFDGKILKAKNISANGIKIKLKPLEYQEEIPPDFKMDSNFYFLNGKIKKKKESK